MSGEWEAVADAVEDSEDITRRTRNRICKHCKFSTSNAREFLHHQLTAHTDSDSTGDIAALSTTLDIPNQKRSHTKPYLLSPGRRSSAGSGSQPASPHIMSDSELMEGDAEEELLSGGDLDDREEMVIGKAVLPTRTYTCQDCGMSTTSARNHLYHQLEEHKYDFIIYECDICDYATRYKQKLPRHRKCHFNNLRPGVNKSPQTSAMLLNNNNVLSPKQTGGLDGPVFPDEPIPEEYDVEEARNVEDDMLHHSPLLPDDSEAAEYSLPPDNPRVGKLVSAENPNTMETIQLIDEGDNSVDGQGALQIDMSRVEEEPLPSSPLKEKLVVKETLSVLKPKIKRTTPVRQWVDPAKYVTLTDEEGIKYSCSKCGNVYKWRKSLSKHWKEKHENETPPPIQNRSSPYTSLSIPKLSPSVGSDKKPVGNSSKYSPSRVHSKYINSSPARSNYNHTTSQHTVSPIIYDQSPRSTYKMSSHPKPPRLPSPNRAPSTGMTPKPAHSYSDASSHIKCDEDALDLSVRGQVVNLEKKQEPRSAASTSSNISAQDQPLDFSSKHSTPYTQIKQNDSHQYPTQDQLSALTPNENPKSFQCSKCAYVAVSTDDFKRHFETHTQKKFQRCGQCHAQFANVDDLNRHFVMEHQEQLEDFMEEEESLLKSHLMAPPISQQVAALSPNCMVCSTLFSTSYELARHFSNAHSNLPNPYLKKNYMNLGIGKRILTDELEQPDSKKRRIMEAKETPDRVHTCNSCGYSSSWKNDLTLHMRKYHPLTMSRPLSREGSPLTSDQGMILPTVLASHNNTKNRAVTPGAPLSIQTAKDSPPQDSVALTSQHQQYLADIPDTVDLSQEGTVLVIPEAPEENVPKHNIQQNSPVRGKQPKPSPGSSAEMLLPYKCSVCEYRARWPSEITQHMKNHSDEKPYCCPRCSYRSKWKWDVVKHLKRCGGGTIKDVIDTTKLLHVQKDTAENTKTLTTNSLTNSPVPAVSLPSSAPPAPPNVTVVPGASLQEAPKPQGNSSDAIVKLASTKQTIFRSIINQGQYHCLECPFIGSSPAELKRHVILHSDEKPFSCRDCSYSSRWKCDLKKHLRTYNHQPAQKVVLASTRGRRSLVGKHSRPMTPPPQLSPVTASSASSHSVYSSMSVSSANPAIAAAVLSTSPVSTSVPSPSSSDTSNQSAALYQCEKCPYATHKKNILDSHMKIHTQRSEMGSRLICKQCDFEAADLPEFLQHKLTHFQTNQEQDHNFSAAASNNISLEDADTDSQSPKEDLAGHSMRHRRKPIRQFKCSKCPYVCFKKNGLELHEAMHEPRGEEAHRCPYCDYNVYNASLLQQHLRLHPEHQQQQWEEDAGGEEMLETDTYDPWGMQQQTDVEDNNDDPMDEDDADHHFMNMDDEEEERLQQQVVTQEMSIMAASAVDTPIDGLSEASSGDCAVLDLAKKPMGSSEMVTMFSMSDYEDRLPREMWSASYQCTSCPYLTQHRSNYDKHIRMHGTNNKFTCEWCDWSIDRLNLLYRHAKCVHPNELAKQEKNDFFDKVRDKSPVVLNMNPKPKKKKVPTATLR